MIRKSSSARLEPVPVLPRAMRASLVVALGLVAASLSVVLWRPVRTFSTYSLSFWASNGLVLSMWSTVGVACWGALTNRRQVLFAAAASPAGGLVGAAVMGALLYRATPLSVWGALLASGLVWLTMLARVGLRVSALTGLVLGFAFGALHVSTRGPPKAATHAVNAAEPQSVSRASSRVEWQCGRLRLLIEPLMALQLTSADGFWPGVARADSLEGEPPLTGPNQRGWLVASDTSIEASTTLSHAVATHLNRFTDVVVMGAERPRVAFDAMAPLEFKAFDYPKGRVAHFAYATERELVVAHGSNAEKGPFVRMASAPLRDELRLTLYDGDQAQCALVFLDFVAQADVTNESPTAGEGVRPNVIQFGMSVSARTGKQGPPTIHLSLAETGIGAGRDTVMISAGRYRNRIRLDAQ